MSDPDLAERADPPRSGPPAPARVALGLLAGVCIAAALPPWGWWPLAPVGIAAWVALSGGLGRLGRFGVGWAVGVGWFAPSTLWMWGLTAPGYVLGVLLAWGPMVGAAGLLAPADRRRYVALPAAIVAFEWFHTHAPFGGVPLSMLAMSQSRAPLLPIAALGGSLLLGAAVAVLGVALHQAVADRRWQEPVAVLAVLAVLVGLGTWWPLGEPGPTVRIAAVQGGGPQGTRFSSDEAPLVYQRHLEATRGIDPAEDLDLVMWPENAINVDGVFLDGPWPAELAAEARRLDATVLVGVVEDAPGDPDRFVNYVVAIEPDGSIEARYDKVRRVPFGEYVPMRPLFEPIAEASLPPRDQIPGTGTAAIETSAGPMAVAVSWEVFFSRRVREGVREGGEIVLNPTNGSSYWLTQIQTQQVAASALRAVESGRWVVQAAPTGFSAIVDDSGSVLQRTDISERAIVVADVPRRSGTTPAQRLGDLPAALIAAAALLVADRPRWRALLRRRTDAPTADS